MASSSLRALSRLVANTQKPMTTGIGSEVRRTFATTSIFSDSQQSRYTAIESKRGSLYHLLWKRKFTWLFVGGAMFALAYEIFNPDKENRTKMLMNEWAHKSGGAYDPMKPQKENMVKPKAE